MKKAPIKKAKAKSNPVGRPEFKITKAMRNRVERFVSCSMSIKDISRAIGCSVPTLKLHFEEELATGAAKKRGRIIDLLYDAAENGNVSAQRKLVSMTTGGDLKDSNMKFSSTKYEDDFDIEDRPLHNKRYAKGKGKKELQQEEANRVTGTFAPPEPPKLIVDNVKK